MSTEPLVIGTRRTAVGRHEGVIRQGAEVVFSCGHAHNNRDQSTQTNGRSARDCVALLIRCARFPGVADDLRRDILSGPGAYARRWSASAGTMQRMREAAEQQVEELAALVAKVREVTGTQAIHTFNRNVLFPAYEEASK